MKKFIYGIMLAAPSLMVASCSSDSPGTPDTPDNGGNEINGTTVVSPLAPDAEMNNWLSAQTRTGADILGVLADKASEGENVLFSPFSIYSAMSMLANGAQDTRLDEIMKFLNAGGMTVEKLNAYNKALLENFPQTDPGVKMQVANAAWLDQKFDVRPEFTGALEASYSAETFRFDFSGDIKGDVNRWVNKKTEGLIPAIFGEEDRIMPPFVLANAFYFKGAWSQSFDAAETERATFTCSGGSSREVEMMHSAEMCGRFGTIDGTEVLTLPFGNGLYTVTFAMPAAGSDLGAFARTLTASRLTEIIRAGKGADGEVWLPKFSVEESINFRTVLESLGLREIFEFGEWGGMTPDPTNLIAVDKVLQKVCFAVDETGGEGAGASAIIMDIMSPGTPQAPQAKPSFRADRPFVFIVTEQACQLPVFIGAVNKI